MPRSKGRRKTKETRARTTQIAQRDAERAKITPQQYARRRFLGWTLVTVGIAVAASHWLAHVGVLYEDRPLWDLVAGYPAGIALGIGGTAVLSR